MSRNTWKFLLVIFVVAWSLFELYPPKPRDLIQVFQELAEAPDATLNDIVAKATEAQKQNSNQFLNLLTATGTNDLARYFPDLVEEEAPDQTRTILHRIQERAAGKIKLGLDLQGGVEFLVSMDATRLKDIADVSGARAQVIEVLRKRVDRFGVAEPIIKPMGQSDILIQLPGLTDAEKEAARAQIQRTAFLEFRLVHPESDSLVRQEIVEPGYELKSEKSRNSEPGAPRRVFLVSKQSERGLGGQHVSWSGVHLDPVTGQPKISVRFNSEGAALFGEVTRDSVGRLMAIILDGELYSAPRINEPILGGNCEISGDFEITEAATLANVLQNPLQAPVSIQQERSVDPSLGRDSIQSGVTAAIVGVAAVGVFMLVYYLVAGVVAILAMLLNILVLFGVLCSVGTTLTLPGIAGIVLTIGMAVDANVLIYERIREELATGKSIRGALAAGYDKAFGTIFDSNLTTLIASVILIFMGTGPVKGFGVVLTIGVSVSMFTALVVTRLIFDFLLARGLLKGLPMLHLIRGSKLNFLKVAKPAFAVSWLLIAVGIGYGFYRGKQVFGVEFRGGDQLLMGFSQAVAVDEVRKTVEEMKIGDVIVGYNADPATGRKTLTVTTEVGTGAKVLEELQKKFPESKFERLALDQVGAVVGQEIQKSAVISVLLAMFGILLYVAFRYEFSFAIGAVVAIGHDILMTLGLYFLSDRQINATTVAAVLTIIGFSINDTIVIFDRIREDLKLGVRGSFAEVINKALNQTLSRTIITSGTVFIATVALYMFGGGAINDFALAFIFGILTGTYSSIYIASALVLWWNKGQRPMLGSGVEIQAVEPQPVKV